MRLFRFVTLGVGMILALMLCAATAQAVSIGITFGDGTQNGDGSGPGVVQNNWNNINCIPWKSGGCWEEGVSVDGWGPYGSSTPTPIGMVDSTGATLATPITLITYDPDQYWADYWYGGWAGYRRTGTVSSPTGSYNAQYFGYDSAVNGYNPPPKLTIANIPYATYDVYIGGEKWYKDSLAGTEISMGGTVFSGLTGSTLNFEAPKGICYADVIRLSYIQIVDRSAPPIISVADGAWADGTTWDLNPTTPVGASNNGVTVQNAVTFAETNQVVTSLTLANANGFATTPSMTIPVAKKLTADLVDVQLGTLTVEGVLNAGIFNVAGGTATLASGSTGTITALNVSAGSASVASGSLHAIATLNASGGTTSLGANIGTALNVSGTGVVNTTAAISVPTVSVAGTTSSLDTTGGAVSAITMNVSGGTATLQGGTIGTLNASGGTVSLGPTAAPVGTLALASGGTVNVQTGGSAAIVTLPLSGAATLNAPAGRELTVSNKLTQTLSDGSVTVTAGATPFKVVGANAVNSMGIILRGGTTTIDQISGSRAAGLDVRAWQGVHGQIDGSLFDMPGSPTHSTYAATIGYATEAINMSGDDQEHFGDNTNSGVPNGSVRPTGYANYYTVEYRGKLYIPTAGTYRFATISDDGSALWIDQGDVATANPSYELAAVQNSNYQGMTLAGSGQINLTAGYHDMIARFYEGDGGNGLDLWWDPTGGENWQLLPGANFFHGSQGPGAVNLPTTDVYVDATSELNLNHAAAATLGNLNISTGVISFATATSVSFNNIAATGNSSIAAGTPISLRTGNISVANTKTLTIDAAIVDGATPTAITKLGLGTAVLSGVNTYTGTTAVNGGTLVVNGSLATDSVVSVNTGGTLAGTGIINGPVYVSGGTIAPGDRTLAMPTLPLTVRNSVDLTGGITSIRIFSSTQNDKLVQSTSGTINFGGVLNVEKPGIWAWVGGTTYDLFDWNDTVSATGTFASINLPTLSDGLTWHEYAPGVRFNYQTGEIKIDSNVVYNKAIANTLPATVDVGRAHVTVGSAVDTFATAPLSIENVQSQPAEGLDATKGTVSDGASLHGADIVNLGVGTTNTDISVGLATADMTTLGSKSGQATIDFASNSGSGTTPLESQTVTVTGFVFSGLGEWKASASGNWNDISAWTDLGGVPGVTTGFKTGQDTATFDKAGTQTITLNGVSPAVSGISFSAGNYTLQASGGGEYVTLDNTRDGGGNATISSASGVHAITTPVVLNSDLTATVAGGSTLTLSGQISGSGKGITKEGAGTLVIAPEYVTNDYSGQTVLKAGTLQLGGTDSIGFATGAGAWNPVLFGIGGADIQGGKMVFDYSGEGGVTPAGDIGTLLKASHDAGWTGQIQSTTAAGNPNLVLGWMDDGASQVTVMLTYAGDWDLNGSVNLDDLNIWKANFGIESGAKFAQGDFDYNGAVNLDDLNAWKATFGLAPLTAVAGPSNLAANVPVPEPSTMALLIAGLAGLLGYIWRKRRS